MIRVYNTKTRQKEDFRPVVPGKVSIYCCGVTPYNHPHIGNARPFVVWDVIRRYFAHKGYEVRYVQNFTDVDDKIINEANAEKTSWKEISDSYIKSYFASMDALNVKRADFYPRVSETMEEIIVMVKTLVDKGYAYPIEGEGVYFSVEKFPGYGALSGRRLEDMEAGARVEVNEKKRHPMDFALWKSAKPGEPAWDSPWGKGRPGWHIECSAMSLKFLGKTFDFHGGGSDLIFPHHENEIAQSVCAIGEEHSFARYWLHNGFITIRNEKMSKSKNNFFLVTDILKEFPGEVIRFFILSTHYRSPLDFSYERLEEAQTALGRLANTWETISKLENEDGLSTSAASVAAKARDFERIFDEAMEDDFNTALAISQMFALSKEINIYAQSLMQGEKFDRENFATAAQIYRCMASIIGIFEAKEKPSENDLSQKLMEFIINLRQDARKEKNWELADKIRDGLKEIGIALEDTPQGAKWKKI